MFSNLLSLSLFQTVKRTRTSRQDQGMKTAAAVAA
jgi:hypothetical protein